MDAYEFVIDGPIVPKARPRAWNGRNLIPKKYRQWKKGAIAVFSQQWQHAPLSGVDVSIQLSGKHSRRGDLDNISGAILDALVQSEVLKDDNLINVQSLAIGLDYDKKLEPTTIVRITKA